MNKDGDDDEKKHSFTSGLCVTIDFLPYGVLRRPRTGFEAIVLEQWYAGHITGDRRTP